MMAYDDSVSITKLKSAVTTAHTVFAYAVVMLSFCFLTIVLLINLANHLI
jgi:hypothetical protein